MAVKLIAAMLALLLLGGCAQVLGPIKEAAGLSKPPPVPDPPPAAPRDILPRNFPAPEHDWPGGGPPNDGWPDDSLPGDDWPEDDGWSDWPGDDWPEDGGWNDWPEDGGAPPDATPAPDEGEAGVYYNGYLGLTVTIPEECRTNEDWYMEINEPAVLTEAPEDSASQELFDWEDNEGGGYFLSLMEIDFYTGDAEYGFYSLMLDYFPDMTEEEYFAFTEAFLEEDEGTVSYTITGSGTVAVNGAEARHYTLELRDLEDTELAYTLEYFITPVRGMYVLQVLTYPPDSTEAMTISRRLAQEVCAFGG